MPSRVRKLVIGLKITYQAASTMRQMLAALKCCHEHYMGHFDVKPETLRLQTFRSTTGLDIRVGCAAVVTKDVQQDVITGARLDSTANTK